MKRTFIICSAILCMAMGSANAQTDKKSIDNIVTMAQTDNQVMDHLDVLSNRIGGRVIGSNNYDNAVEWMVRKFTEWGLEVEVQEAGTLPVGFNRGPWFGKMTGDESMTLHFATPSYTSGTKGLQRGHVVIEPRNMGEFNRMKGTIKGAWVLVNGTSVGFAIDRTAKGDSIRASILQKNMENGKKNAEIAKSNRENNTNNPLLEIDNETPALLYKEMIEAGALGFIQAADLPIRAMYDRSIMTDETFTFDNLPTACDIKLERAQYDKIRNMVSERRNVWLEFDIRNHFRPGPVKYHSVIGKIKGTKYPDEYVIASGHIDAYDVATGGVDCGSGLSSVIEAARMVALSGAKPKRTMLFIGFAGEEFGLLGALAWAKENKSKLGKISNVFNRDGGPLAPTYIVVSHKMEDDFKKICEPIARINPEYSFTVKTSDPVNKPTRLGGSDASVFAMEGVPAISFGEEDVKGYNFNYREIWHTERDLYTKSIPEYQKQAAAVMAIVTLGVANLDHQLSREGLYK